MINGIGIDIVETRRVARLLAKHSERFISRVFSPEERLQAGGSAEREAQFYAARWAAKEAAYKALAPQISFYRFASQCKVSAQPAGVPVLSWSNAGERRLHLSLTHTAEHAAAVVVVEGV